MDEEDAKVIFEYLSNGTYPSEYDKYHKRALRQKTKAFFIHNNKLFHKGKGKREQLVVTNQDERISLIKAFHYKTTIDNNHNGVLLTIRSLMEKYWWRKLVQDVKNFCKKCPLCNKQNFNKVDETFQLIENEDNIEPKEDLPNLQATFELSSYEYKSNFFETINDFFINGIGCDVIIISGNYHIKVHRIILLYASGYFKSLLMDNDLPIKDSIQLSDISGDVIDVLISFMYTGTLRIGPQNINKIKATAIFLQMPLVVKLCEQHQLYYIDYNKNKNIMNSEDLKISNHRFSPNINFLQNKEKQKLDSKKLFECPKHVKIKLETHNNILNKSYKNVMNLNNKMNTRSSTILTRNYNFIRHKYNNLQSNKTLKLTNFNRWKTIQNAVNIKLFSNTNIIPFNKIITCSFCYTNFKTSSQLKAHLLKLHIANLSCKICNIKFPSFSSLKIHLRRHTLFKIKYIMPSAKTDHFNKLLQKVKNLKFKCGWCGIQCMNDEDLCKHRFETHKKKQIKNHTMFPTVLEWVCDVDKCTVKFKLREHLLKHMKYDHPHIKFECDQCNYRSPLKQMLKRHLERGHKETNICQLCGKSLDKPFLLRVHMFNKHKIHDPQLKLYKCEAQNCDYKCPTMNAFKFHMIKHNENNLFSCELCGKIFKRQNSLELHKNKVHLNILPCVCDKCGTSYVDEAALKSHMLRHSETKPFSCTFCSFSTFQRGCLKSHLFSRHQYLLDEKMSVYQCNMCKFSTEKKCRYVDHMKMHRDIRDLPCPHCTKYFITNKTLKQHVRKVHNFKQFICLYCQFKTSSSTILDVHLRQTHRIDSISNHNLFMNNELINNNQFNNNCTIQNNSLLTNNLMSINNTYVDNNCNLDDGVSFDNILVSGLTRSVLDGQNMLNVSEDNFFKAEERGDDILEVGNMISNGENILRNNDILSNETIFDLRVEDRIFSHLCHINKSDNYHYTQINR